MARNRKRKADGSLSKYIFLGICFITVLSMALLFIVYEEPVERNLLTGCPLNKSLIEKQYSFLLDTTEPLVQSQLQEVSFRIEQIIRNLKTNDLIRFYSVESSQDSGTRRLSILNGGQSINYYCIPNSESWLDSPLRQQQLALIPQFLTSQAITSIDNNTVQGSSPIIDALRYIQADDERMVTAQDIYVVSDMIENSTVLSMYRPEWYENEYLKNQNTILSQRPIFRPNAEHNINILAIMRPRHSDVQNSDWASFWTHMIKGTNPSSSPHINLTIERISGGL